MRQQRSSFNLGGLKKVHRAASLSTSDQTLGEVGHGGHDLDAPPRQHNRKRTKSMSHLLSTAALENLSNTLKRNNSLRRISSFTSSCSSSCDSTLNFAGDASLFNSDHDVGPSDKVMDLYAKFSSAKASEKRTIKVDLCPDVTADKAFQVFTDVARSCGFATVHRINETTLMVNELRNYTLLCGPKHDTHFEFPILQELVVRDYGHASTKYAALFLSWLDTTPKLIRQGAPPQGNLIPHGLTQAFGKKGKINKKGLHMLIEEVIGRWRATLFQREYAWEAAALDNNPDAPWQSLNADEVDYEDSEDEMEGAVMDAFDTFSSSGLCLTSASQFSMSGYADCPLPPPPPIPTSTPSFFGNVGFATDPSPPNPQNAAMSLSAPSSEHKLTPRRRKKKNAGANHKSHSMQMLRPKSALKLTSASSGIPHEKRKPLSVSFSKEGVQVEPLEISKSHREARMGVGCTATNQFGQMRPLTSTRTGCLIFLENLDLHSGPTRDEEKFDLWHQENVSLENITNAIHKIELNTSSSSNNNNNNLTALSSSSRQIPGTALVSRNVQPIQVYDLPIPSPRKKTHSRKSSSSSSSCSSPSSSKRQSIDRSPQLRKKHSSSKNIPLQKNQSPRLRRRPSVPPSIESKEEEPKRRSRPAMTA